MLYGLVRGAVLTHTERVVRPDIYHVQTHERRQTHRRLHVVREDEECSACGDNAAMQRHAVHHARHRQLRHARLEELARKVTLGEGLGLLQEAVRLVRVAQVGRRHDHVVHLLGIDSEHRRRSGAGRDVRLHLYLVVVYFGYLARKEPCQLTRQIAVLGTPCRLGLAALRRPHLQLAATRLVYLAALGEDLERVLLIAAQMAYGSRQIGSSPRQRLSVRRDTPLETAAVGTYGTFGHNRVADDNRRLLGLGIGLDKSRTQLLHIVAVDRDHVPVPCAVLSRNILIVHLVDLGRELHVVRVVVHDQVAQSQMSRYTAHALRDLLLHGAVRDEGIGLVLHPLAETCRHEPLGDGCAQRHGMALTQRARGVLHTVH